MFSSNAFERELFSYSSHNSSVTRLSAAISSTSTIFKARPPGKLLLIKILINSARAMPGGAA